LPKCEMSCPVSASQGLLLRGTRIVMPKCLRHQTLSLAHEGHQGIVRTKQLLRQKVWWPGIDAEAETLVKTCLPCQSTICTRTASSFDHAFQTMAVHSYWPLWPLPFGRKPASVCWCLLTVARSGDYSSHIIRSYHSPSTGDFCNTWAPWASHLW
jgi:hypothetical protein